ncbi:MAG: MerR family DNA-binding transcriptional regulator [Pseudoruegeria sp.]
MSEDVMTIREMCDNYGVTARALRFYEAKELLAPIREGQKRLYRKSDRARLRLILRGKRFGFSLEEIRQLLNLYGSEGGKDRQLREVVDLGRLRLADMENQRDELNIAIEDLRGRLKWGEDQLK